MFKILLVIWVVLKRHIMVIALCIYLPSGGTAIAEPSAIEEKFFIPGQEMSEFRDGRLQNWKLRAEKNINPIGTRGPVNGVRENIREFSMESVGKFLSGIVEGVFFVPIRHKAMSGDNPKEDNNKANGPRYIFAEDIVHAFPLIFLFLLALYIVTQP